MTGIGITRSSTICEGRNFVLKCLNLLFNNLLPPVAAQSDDASSRDFGYLRDIILQQRLQTSVHRTRQAFFPAPDAWRFRIVHITADLDRFREYDNFVTTPGVIKYSPSVFGRLHKP